MPNNPSQPNRNENARRLGLSTFIGTQEASASESITSGISSAGAPFLEVQGQQLYAPLEPVAVAGREAAGLVRAADPELVVFFGLGLGLHLTAVEALCGAAVVVYEPDAELLDHVLSAHPFELARTTVVNTAEELRARVTDFLGGRPRRVVAGALPPWTKLRPEAFEEFRTVLNEVLLQAESDLKTRHRFSEEWVRNMAANLPRLGRMKELTSLGRRFAGRPAILVGAGPSLDNSLEGLREAQGKALILAVHTAAPVLFKAGMVPELTIIIEGQKLDHYFDGIDNLDATVLLPSPQTHPDNLALPVGDVLGISHEGNAAADWLTEAYQSPAFRACGSVACVGFSILHHLGCDPIILTGMDLAYNEERGHASAADTGCCTVTFDRQAMTVRTTCHSGRHEQKAFNLEEVPAWGGQGTALTRPALSTFRHWFEAAARSWGRGPRLLNATEGGARIAGFEDMPLAEALAVGAFEGWDPGAELRAALAVAEARDPARLAQAVETELKAVRGAEQAAILASEAAEPVLKMLRARRLDKVQPRIDALSKKEQELQAITRSTRLLNTLVGHRAREIQPPKPGQDVVAQTIASVEGSAAISRLVLDGARELLDMFTPALEKLRQDGGES